MFRIAALGSLFLLCAWASPADDKLVVPEDNAPIQLCPGCTKITVLLRSGKTQIDLNDQPQVAGVFLAGARKLTDGFTAQWVGSKRPQALEITLNPDAIIHSGTYDLYVDLQPQTNPTAERLRLQLVHPEPKLNGAPKLLIDRTYYLFGWKCDTRPRLTLVESSNLSNLTKIKIQQLTNTILGSKQIGGTLQFTNPADKIDAGAVVPFDYQLVDEFELGTATGTFTVTAAETNNPIGSVDFEVRSHLHWIYIGLTIIAGLVSSYFLKVHLQLKLELDQARLDARKLLERIAQEEGKHLDPVFRKAYNDARVALETALGEKDPASINNKKTELDTAWRNALQSLATRHQDQEAILNKIRDITSTDWLDWPSIREVIEKTRAQLPRIQTSLDTDDLPDASQRLRDGLTSLGDGIRTAAYSWQLRVGELLDQLTKPPQGISKSMSEKLDKPAQDLRASLNRISPATQLSTPEQIQQALADIKGERIAASQFFDWLTVALSTEVSAVTAEFQQIDPTKWNSTAFACLPKAASNLNNFLSAVADTPNPQELPSLLGSLHTAWVHALQDQFPAPLEDVKQLLEARDYEVAAETALHQLKENNDLLGPTEAATLIPFRLPAYSRDVSRGSTPPAYVMRTHFQTLFTAEPVTPTSFTEQRQLWRDKFWQSVVIGLILIVLGYTLQLATFVGTFTEISTLFFWAFGLDLTLDTVKTLSAKKT